MGGGLPPDLELAKDWGDGVCATEPLLQTLVANPELVEKLGFCTKPKGWAQDAALYKQYQSMLDIAASYGTLSRAATDAGLAFDDNDEGTIQSGEFDDQDWSYREFEEAVVRLVRACRGRWRASRRSRERYAANAERVSKKKVKPKKGLFGAFVARGWTKGRVVYSFDGDGRRRTRCSLSEWRCHRTRVNAFRLLERRRGLADIVDASRLR